MSVDYYDILEVGRDASEEDIKKSYRRLARRYHPDANHDDPDTEQKFKEVAEAYSVLSDPQRRHDYDRFGTASVPAGGFDPFDIFTSIFGGTDPFDIFGTRGRERSQGNDLFLEVDVTLDEVMRGGKKEVTIDNFTECAGCDGSGGEPGTGSVRCPECGGAGAVRSVQRSILGNVMTSFTCPKCRGAGQIIEHPCRICDGSGRTRAQEKVTIEIPPGVDDGIQYKIPQRGEAGMRGAGRGDLIVRFAVLPHESFKRNGPDLIASLAIPFTQAVLGATLEVDTFDGPIELEVAAGSQPGKVIRIRGKGAPRLGRSSRGDLLVQLTVEVPKDLTEEQERMLRRFAELRGEQVSDSAGLMDKIKAVFRS
jgi:molecular chaperone DnaJ